MKNIFWITTIILAFVAGYLSHGINPAATTSIVLPKAEQMANNAASNAIPVPLSTVKEPATPVTKQTKAAESEVAKNAAKQAALEMLEASDDPKQAAKKFPNEISDEEVDKIVPAPFNKSLKSTHGELREKYKKFAETNTPNDWDINIQNKLTDFILSRPHAKFINLESVICKANFCEIRLFETKNGSWQFILSEMALQDWWDFGSYGSSGLSPEEGDKRGTSYLVLLTRKPSMQ